MKKKSRLVLEGAEAERLHALAARWNVAPAEALRRVLDQAFVGRGAAVALEAGFILASEWMRAKTEKPKTEKLKEE